MFLQKTLTGCWVTPICQNHILNTQTDLLQIFIFKMRTDLIYSAILSWLRCDGNCYREHWDKTTKQRGVLRPKLAKETSTMQLVPNNNNSYHFLSAWYRQALCTEYPASSSKQSYEVWIMTFILQTRKPQVREIQELPHHLMPDKWQSWTWPKFFLTKPGALTLTQCYYLWTLCSFKCFHLRNDNQPQLMTLRNSCCDKREEKEWGWISNLRLDAEVSE